MDTWTGYGQDRQPQLSQLRYPGQQLVKGNSIMCSSSCSNMLSSQSRLSRWSTSKLDPNAHAGPCPKGQICQPSTPITPSLVPKPPFRLEVLSIFPPPLVMMHGVHTDVEWSSLGNCIRSNLQCKFQAVAPVLLCGSSAKDPFARQCSTCLIFPDIKA